ncbi:MAG: hypothetical protein EP330_12275 [Deltaproteobacteria bacterium]|nr:MAG: hypothetical protein EP330_12275 [Deltaproteobacteria bacterium]
MPIREAVARLIAPAPEPDPRIGQLVTQVNELEAKITKLEKRLSMTMGALQAATAQLTGLDKRTDEALSTARQASQLATTARSTAESVAEAIEALEDPADTSVLDGSVGKIREALATGEFDGMLDELARAERAGKARKGVLAVIEARR